jgi:UDP-N-acetyl-D-galactosamine dehydrogenase
VILAGRRINDNMGAFVAQKLIKLLAASGSRVHGARVGVFGLTFKPKVSDLRNSKVSDIVRELESFGAQALVHDPLADPADARRHYGIGLRERAELTGLDAAVLAVPHRSYLELPAAELLSGVREDGVVVDVHSALDPAQVGQRRYWSL